MKKLLQLLTALLMLVALVGCDMFGSDSDSDADADDTVPASLVSTWWVKGSFDGWADSVDAGTRHFFTKDELNNNILTYEVTGLYTLDYEFVIANGDKEWKAPEATTTVSDTAVVFVDADYANATFTAAKTSYTITVDITDPAAPSVTIVAGATDSIVPDFAKLSSDLKIKGSAFDPSWGEIVGVADAAAKTVTFADLTMSSTSCEFGFSSTDGFLNAVDTTITHTAQDDITAAIALVKEGGSNISIADVPKSDSLYTVVVTIDDTLAVDAGRYTMTVELSTIGVTDWAIDFAWLSERIQMQGSLFVIGWNATDPTSIDAVAKTVTWDVTIADAAGAFGFPSFDGYLKPMAATAAVPVVAVGETSAAIALPSGDTDGSFATAVAGETYSITVTIDDTLAVDTGRYTFTVKRNS